MATPTVNGAELTRDVAWGAGQGRIEAQLWNFLEKSFVPTGTVTNLGIRAAQLEATSAFAVRDSEYLGTCGLHVPKTYIVDFGDFLTFFLKNVVPELSWRFFNYAGQQPRIFLLFSANFCAVKRPDHRKKLHLLLISTFHLSKNEVYVPNWTETFQR